jgi:molybdopterin-containing oxidoreductase family membrane subunit
MELAEVDRLVLTALAPPGRRLKWVVTGLLLAIGVGVAAFLYQLERGLGVAGINHPVGWAVYIASFVYWVGIAHSGTLISAALLLARARWRLPLARAAEAMTLAALAVAGLFPLIHLGKVGAFTATLPIPNPRGLWPNFVSPLSWDVLAILTYLIVSALFFYVSLLPDLASARDASAEASGRRGFTLRGHPAMRWLALGWRGTSRQYLLLGAVQRVLAGLATALVLFVSTVVSFDFATSILPGWHATHFGPYFVSGALHSGLAMVLLVLISMRRGLRLGALIGREHLARVARLLGVTTLVMGYFYLVEPAVAWLSGDPAERAILHYRATGPYAPVFYTMLVLNVALPASLLWRGPRTMEGWLAAVAIFVNVGMWLERVLIVVTTTAHDFLPANWGFYLPTSIELAVLAGALGLFVLVLIVLLRTVPPIGIAELKAELVAEAESDSPAGAGLGEAVRAGSMPLEEESRAPSARVTERAVAEPVPGEEPGVLGVFKAARSAGVAARALASARLGPVEVLGPCATAAHRAVPAGPWPARAVFLSVLAGAALGFALGLWIPLSTAREFALVVGAKPVPPLPAYLVVAGFLSLLGGSLGGGAAFLALALFRRRRHDRLERAFDPRFSRDRFGVFVGCDAGRAPLATELLQAAGAEEIRGGA